MDPSRNHSSSSHRSFVEGVPHRSSALNQQKLEYRATSFSQRVDRHGRLFGERLHAAPSRGHPLKNKIVPHGDLNPISPIKIILESPLLTRLADSVGHLSLPEPSETGPIGGSQTHRELYQITLKITNE